MIKSALYKISLSKVCKMDWKGGNISAIGVMKLATVVI